VVSQVGVRVRGASLAHLAARHNKPSTLAALLLSGASVSARAPNTSSVANRGWTSGSETGDEGSVRMWAGVGTPLGGSRGGANKSSRVSISVLADGEGVPLGKDGGLQGVVRGVGAPTASTLFFANSFGDAALRLAVDRGVPVRPLTDATEAVDKTVDGVSLDSTNGTDNAALPASPAPGSTDAPWPVTGSGRSKMGGFVVAGTWDDDTNEVVLTLTASDASLPTRGEWTMDLSFDRFSIGMSLANALVFYHLVTVEAV
jgi:hypothetical protein